VCGNDFLVPIPFPLPSNHSHSQPSPFQHCIPIFPITSIPIPTHSHSRQRLLYRLPSSREMCIFCVVNSKQNQIRLHNFHALTIYSLKLITFFLLIKSSLFQFVHFSVKIMKILHVHRSFSSQSTLKIHNFKFKNTQITFNDRQFV